MQRYKDVSGESGVSGYEIKPDAIVVRFKSGEVYLYNDASAGRIHVEAMKDRARKGRGLSTYIAQHVKQSYAAKQT